MKRQITIYESAKNGKITVFNDVECNTLAELKALLREKGIDYSDKEFVEGVTNTKLLSDDSRIPTNIPFRGKETNDVFINILSKYTKIKSGMDYNMLSRLDLLRAAKQYADEIQEKYHQNYTRVKSDDLAYFLAFKDKELAELEESKKVNKESCTFKKEIKRIKEILLFLAEEVGVWTDVNDMLEEEEPEVTTNGGSNFSVEDIKEFLGK